MSVRLRPAALDMANLPIHKIDSGFFKKWAHEMSYVLGYIVADGCIAEDKKRKTFIFNITSKDKLHLIKIKRALGSTHKLSEKYGSSGNKVSQLQIRNSGLTNDLINLGIMPRKSRNLGIIKVPNKYYPDFVRGFFDGDGSVYLYNVNNTPQIKAHFISTSPTFLSNLNSRVCASMNIRPKTIHKQIDVRGRRMPMYSIHLYIDDCEKLNRFMYSNRPSLYLARKRNVFKKWELLERRHYIKCAYPSKIGWHLNPRLFRQI